MKITFDPFDRQDAERVFSVLNVASTQLLKQEVREEQPKPTSAAPVATPTPTTVAAAPAPAPAPQPAPVAAPAPAPAPQPAPVAAAPAPVASADDQAVLVDLIQKHTKAFGPKATVDFFAGKQIKGIGEISADKRPAIIGELQQLLAFAG